MYKAQSQKSASVFFYDCQLLEESDPSFFFDSNLEIDEWTAPKRKLSQRSNGTEIDNDFELQIILMSFKPAL